MTSPPSLRLHILPAEYAVARLDPLAAVPPLAEGGSLSSVSRTARELSIVAESERIPAGIQAERGWRAFEVQGPLDFGLTGVVAGLTAPLAANSIPVFVISTFDTDYLLIPRDRFDDAIATLSAIESFTIEEAPQ